MAAAFARGYKGLTESEEADAIASKTDTAITAATG